MVFFDLESANGVLYKLEAVKFEKGDITRRFCVFTNCEMSEKLQKITQITKEQTKNGVSEREAIMQFSDFLQQCGAVGKQQKEPSGIDFLPIDCAGFGVSEQLQKILFRYGIRATFSQNQFRGDLYIYAKKYCNHLTVKNLRLFTLYEYFEIKKTGLEGLYDLAGKLKEEKGKDIDKKQCDLLCKKLICESERQEFIPKMTQRVSADLARILLFDVGMFRDTITKLYEKTKDGKYAADDWRRVMAGIEKEVFERKGESAKNLLDTNLPENLRINYPTVLTYRILDGAGKVGANLIEIAYKGTKLLLECGTELESTEYGEQVRERVLQIRYDACLISHYHSDHAGLIERIQKKTPTYIGCKAKKILQASTHKQYKNILGYCGKFTVGGITITPFLCDHSAMDSFMLLFEAGRKSILYTGDFRAHGRKNFDKLLLSLPKVDVLICEHTNSDGRRQWSEQTLEKKLIEDMCSDQDIYVLASTTNIDRIVTVYKACLKTKRILIMDKTQAKILNEIGGSIPHPRSHKNIKVIGEKGFSYTDLADLPMPFTILVRSSMGKEINILLGKRKNAKFIYSMWRGYQEKEDMQKFVGIFQKRNIEIKVLHTSGHADSMAIQKLIDKVNPDEISYVHGEKV